MSTWNTKAAKLTFEDLEHLSKYSVSATLIDLSSGSVLGIPSYHDIVLYQGIKYLKIL